MYETDTEEFVARGVNARAGDINGFETAYLTTDDYRIPAIKCYLRAGFEPEMTEDDHPERWEKIFAAIGR